MAIETEFAVEAVALNRVYGGGGQQLAALKDVSLSIARGEEIGRAHV